MEMLVITEMRRPVLLPPRYGARVFQRLTDALFVRIVS
jgi:hypothetical protein